MTESRTCSRCGAELPADAPGGHCLPCLLQLGLQSGETAGEDVAAGVPPASEGGILPPGPSLAEKPGDRIGHYKLLQQIGEGGCGVVYMAEQEEPVRRRVALKIIKLGMDTRNVIARFEAERQALAMMDHPNIAKVFDAGVTEAPLPTSGHPPHEPRSSGRESAPSEIQGSQSRLTSAATVRGDPTRHSPLTTHYGRPYFVMELVRGLKITTYCDQQKLSTRQRLDLFIQVCQAVQHAHQKGIIHRDLKPSNILVTEQDGAPVPKIIDFGIAKATTDQRLTDKTLFTAFEQFIGTPAYMSPEQAGLGGLDIDTRTDTYSLGVLLYELLAGQPPFDPEELRRSALDEILRVIREQEPPRPSTCLTKLTKQELTTVAERRQTEATKLPHLLRGDLDWIVMKALEKDRRRRYETANGFARDLQRFLDNEAVTARPPSNLYRFQKLVRRNKLALVAGSAVSAALILGFCVSIWLFTKERKALHRAVTSEKRVQIESLKSPLIDRQNWLVEATRQHLVMLSRFPEARGTNMTALTTFFGRLIKFYTNYTDFGLIETNGDLVTCSFGRKDPANLADRHHLQRVLKTRDLAIGEYQAGDGTNKPSLPFGYPILDEEGKLARVVYAALDLTVLIRMDLLSELPDRGVIQILDRNGHVLACYPEPEKWVGKSVFDSPVFKTVLAKEEGFVEMPGLDGVSRWYAFAPIRNGRDVGYFVVVGIPTLAVFPDKK